MFSKLRIIAAVLLIAAPASVKAEELCQLSLAAPSACDGKPWTELPEPYQWVEPSSSCPNGCDSDYERQTPAMQFVGVMTSIQFYSQHCLNFTPNQPLIDKVKAKLGITDHDIEAGKYNEEIEMIRFGAEHVLESYSDDPVHYCETYVPISFAKDGNYHGFATITKHQP